MKPLLSMIIPIYNVEIELSELLSVLGNLHDRNIEFIFVNDGSTDNSLKVLNTLCKVYLSHVDYQIFSKSNGGLSDARNYGKKYARGKFIWFVDSDDLIQVDNVRYLIKWLDVNPKVDIVLLQYQPFVKLAEIKQLMKSNDTGNAAFTSIDHNQLMEKVFLRKIDSHSWGYIAKNELYQKNCIDFPVGRNFEDLAVTYKVFFNSKTIVSFSEIVYFYRFRQNSIVNDSTKVESNIKDIMITCDEILFNKNRLQGYANEMDQFVFSLFLTAFKFAIGNQVVISKQLYNKLDNRIKTFDVSDFPLKKKAVHFLYRIGVYQLIKRGIRSSN